MEKITNVRLTKPAHISMNVWGVSLFATADDPKSLIDNIYQIQFVRKNIVEIYNAANCL